MKTIWINLYRGPALDVPGSYSYITKDLAERAAVIEQPSIRHPHLGAFPVEVPDRVEEIRPLPHLECGNATMTTELATIIRVRIEEGKAGLFYATSPKDLRGLLVAKPDIEALFAAIPDAIAALLQATHGKLYAVFAVFLAERGEDPMVHPFIAAPPHILTRAVDYALNPSELQRQAIRHRGE